MDDPYKTAETRPGSRAAAVWAGCRRWIASLRARQPRHASAPRNIIARAGAVVAVITVVAPPSIYAWVATHQLQQRAIEQASVGARHVEVQLPKNQAIDWLTQVSISVLHA